MRVGLNLNAHPDFQHNPERTAQDIKRWGCAWALCMDDQDYRFSRYLHEVSPATQIVMRFKEPNDANFWKEDRDKPARTFEESVLGRMLRAFRDDDQRFGVPWIYHYLLNEPIAANAEELAQMLSWLIVAMDEGRKAGVHLCTGNFNVNPWEIEAKLWDDFLRSAHWHRDWHTVGIHEYSGPSMGNSIDHPAEDFLDPSAVQPGLWPRRDQLSVARDKKGDLPTRWYLRRCDLLTLRARELGLGDPRLLVTEFGWDANTALAHIYSALQQHGLAPGLEKFGLKGYRTLQNVWAWYWPDWTFVEAGARQLAYAEHIYPANVGGLLLFQRTRHSDWQDTDWGQREGTQIIDRAQQLIVEGELPYEPPAPPPIVVIPPAPARTERTLKLALTFEATDAEFAQITAGLSALLPNIVRISKT